MGGGSGGVALVVGSVWLASSTAGRDETSASEPASAAVELAKPPAPVAQVTSDKPAFSGPAARPQPVCGPKQPHKKITPRDMFPVGDITRNLPAVRHPYGTISELFPSFEYEGKVWSTTGRYVRGWQADLTPTGYSLASGQQLYALANTSAPDAVLFVRSDVNPDKFAVYRAT